MYTPKQAPNVYQLIGAVLIGNFLMLPSFFMYQIFLSNVENSQTFTETTFNHSTAGTPSIPLERNGLVRSVSPRCQTWKTAARQLVNG